MLLQSVGDLSAELDRPSERVVVMAPNNLPTALKSHLASQFSDIRQRIDSVYHSRTMELIDLCLNVCNNHSESNTLDQLVKWLEKHDSLRGTSFRHVFPELANYLIN